MDRENAVLTRLEDIASRMEMIHLNEYLRFACDWKCRLVTSFFTGLAKGVGFSIGFTLLGALILYFIKSTALANLPGIGHFLAQVVQIVERNL